MDLYYTASVLITVFSVLAMVVIIGGNHTMPKNKKMWFRVVLIMIALEALAEWVGVFLDGADIRLRTAHIAVKVVEFSLAPVIPVMCTGIIGRFERSRWTWPLLSLHVALELLSARFGFIFCVDAGNVYHRREFYWIYAASFLLGIAVFFIESFRFGHTYQNRNIQGLTMILLFLAAALVPQLLNWEIRTIWLCVAIASILYYAFYSELLQQVDVLTMLLNRGCYEVQIGDMTRPAVILVFDVNGFKEINDTYGHPFGDSCLRVIGRQLKSAYGKYGRCYRTGGDEFCVVLTRSLHAVEDLNEDFLQRLRREQELEPRLPGVAVGYARFDPAHDRIADVVCRADDMMYQCKRQL